MAPKIDLDGCGIDCEEGDTGAGCIQWEDSGDCFCWCDGPEDDDVIGSKKFPKTVGTSRIAIRVRNVRQTTLAMLLGRSYRKPLAVPVSTLRKRVSVSRKTTTMSALLRLLRLVTL